MKRIFLMFVAVVAIALAAEDSKPAPEMPEEVTLTSGRVLRKVQVIRWESGRVVLRHTGGADPIAFSLFKDPAPADLPAIRKASEAKLKTANETKKKLAEVDAKLAEEQQQEVEREKAREVAREEASRHGRLMEGQTMDQVRLVLGSPRTVNEYDSGRDVQAVYDQMDRVTTYYAYFTNGRLTSWQKTRR